MVWTVSKYSTFDFVGGEMTKSAKKILELVIDKIILGFLWLIHHQNVKKIHSLADAHTLQAWKIALETMSYRRDETVQRPGDF